MRHLRTNLWRAAAFGFVLALVGCNADPYSNEPDVSGTGEMTDDTIGAETRLEPRADESGFASWDADSSQGVDESEFDRRFASDWGSTDANRDERWNAAEAAGAFRERWDRNDDDRLDQTEWNAGVATWRFDGGDYGTWADWDADADGFVEEQEFKRAFEAHAWDDWDADGDGASGRNEVADTLWDWFDANDDDVIDSSEWGERANAWT